MELVCNPNYPIFLQIPTVYIFISRYTHKHSTLMQHILCLIPGVCSLPSNSCPRSRPQRWDQHERPPRPELCHGQNVSMPRGNQKCRRGVQKSLGCTWQKGCLNGSRNRAICSLTQISAFFATNTTNVEINRIVYTWWIVCRMKSCNLNGLQMGIFG